VRGNRPGRDPRPVTGAADGLLGIGWVALVALLVVVGAVATASLVLWVMGIGGG
jgi:hypothetical protein